MQKSWRPCQANWQFQLQFVSLHVLQIMRMGQFLQVIWQRVAKHKYMFLLFYISNLQFLQNRIFLVSAEL